MTGVGLFGNKPRDIVPGRAYVVPAGTHSALGNENNTSPDGKVRCEVHLVTISVADGQPFVQPMQKLLIHLPNWVLILFHHAGTNHELADRLPARIEVDVAIETTARTIVDIDLDAAKRDLEPYRALAIDEWRHTDSVLAPVRNVLKLPGFAAKATRTAITEIRSAAGELASALRPSDGPPKPSWTDKQVEQIGRTAHILAHRYQLHPDEHQAARTVALTALPMHAEQVRHGTIHTADFDALVMRELVSTAITQAEADGFYAAAGLEPPTSRPS